jgi:hypothetical protein
MDLPYRLGRLCAAALAVSCASCTTHQSWPPLAPSSSAGVPSGGTGDDALVRSLPLCIASERWSAGELGASVLYRYKREGRRLSVGYFVYWTAERPWGPNFLSYAVLPALLIDAFYSHLFFVFPGVQRVMYGPGDIEGARVVYQQSSDGHWTPVSALTDDGAHHEVELAPDEFVDSDGTVVLTTDVWSHQLGARRAEHPGHALRQRTACFVGASMAPLTPEIADAFRLGSAEHPRRAPPAWKLERARAPQRVAKVGPADVSSR